MAIAHPVLAARLESVLLLLNALSNAGFICEQYK